MNIVEVTNYTMNQLNGVRRKDESFNHAACDLARHLVMQDGPRAEGYSIAVDSLRTRAEIRRHNATAVIVERRTIDGCQVWFVADKPCGWQFASSLLHA